MQYKHVLFCCFEWTNFKAGLLYSLILRAYTPYISPTFVHDKCCWGNPYLLSRTNRIVLKAWNKIAASSVWMEGWGSYAEPATKSIWRQGSQPCKTDAKCRERTACPRWELNPVWPTLTFILGNLIFIWNTAYKFINNTYLKRKLTNCGKKKSNFMAEMLFFLS